MRICNVTEGRGARLGTAAVLLLLAAGAARASDLRDVSLATDRILVVHFNEGHIDQGIDEKTAVPYISKLDTKAAVVASNYAIVSEDDPRYAAEQHPSKAGRKAKAYDTLSLFRPEKFVLDHWIYLELPQPLQPGCTYTVNVTGLAPAPQSFTFLFQESALHSDSIHVCQVGFTPDGPKYAYLSHWMGDLGGANLDAFDGKPFHLVREGSGERAFSGKVAARKRLKDGSPQTNTRLDGTPFNGAKKGNQDKNFTEADVWECDFSAFQAPGRYRVVVEGLGCSFPFEIGEDAYRHAYFTASRGLFFQRSGVEMEIEPGFHYPRSHHPADKRNAFQYDKNWRWIDRPDHSAKIEPTGTLDLWGWYHDAGDWDGYPYHVTVPMTLLLLDDLAGEKFADGQVGNRYKSNENGAWVDEGANGLPDVLDEAKWLIEFYRRARALGQKAGLTTGGVPGGYAGVDSCAGGASWKDTRALKFSAEDPATTFQYAACAAWLAACLDKTAKGAHPESAEWIKEARASWEWAKANMRDGDEGKVRGLRMLAALCLYRVTKDAAFQQQFAVDIRADGGFQQAAEGWAGPTWWELAAGIYGLLPDDFPGLDKDLRKTVREKVIASAETRFVQTAAQRGYRFGFAWNKIHNLGAFSTPMLYTPAIAYKITGEKKYLDVMHTAAAYCLGGNPMNTVWMTGLGQRAVRWPFHPDSWVLIDYNSKVYDNEILPGYVPYGSCESVDFFGPGYHFSGDEDFSRSSAYPDVETWPLSEVRFENRYSIPGGEFTITQNMAPSVFAYGFLCGNPPKKFAPPARPAVAVTFPKEGDVLKAGGDIALRVKTSPDVRRVEYYCNERLLGASDAPPFAFTWRGAPEGAWLITAKAFAASGQISRPNEKDWDVDVNVKLEAAAPAVAAEKLEILNAPAKPLAPGSAWALSASFTPLAASDQAAAWTSSDPKVASVNSQGEVAAKAPGKATIALKAKNGSLKAECIVQVAAPAKP
ncbi:MAG: glycoside hydrolase family 9 protein [Planctomycetota bacterium]|nr:glycoside hydrolase family 9 protein [Planctomycetota bacterium]